MTTTSDTRPVIIDASVDTAAGPAASHVVVQPSRLTARTAGWILAGLLGVAAVSAAVVTHHDDPVAPGVTTSTVSDAAESAHGAGSGLVTGAGASIASRAASVPTTYGDSLVLAHGQAGFVTLADGARALQPLVATVDSTTVADVVQVAHGTSAGIADAAGHRVTR